MKSSAKEYFGVEKFIPKANLRVCYLDVSNQALFVGSDDISIVQSCLLERTHCQPSSFSADSKTDFLTIIFFHQYAVWQGNEELSAPYGRENIQEYQVRFMFWLVLFLIYVK